MEVRYGVHPSDARKMGTQALREEFVVDRLFLPGACNVIYGASERLLFGGLMPIGDALAFPGEVSEALGVQYMLEKRELGVVNIGGEGSVTVDGELFALGKEDALYIGRGTRELQFSSREVSNPAKFYFVSGVAHTSYPARLQLGATAPDVVRSSSTSCGKRRIITYISPETMPSCQLVMGITKPLEGTLWNTMPPHTHIGRSELFMYYGMEEDTAVVQLMGEPYETRHLIVRNEQAVIIPGWSIHSGVGTNSYSLVWATLGENQEIMGFNLINSASLA